MKKGFTLVELLVVVVIILILGMVVVQVVGGCGNVSGRYHRGQILHMHLSE